MDQKLKPTRTPPMGPGTGGHLVIVSAADPTKRSDQTSFPYVDWRQPYIEYLSQSGILAESPDLNYLSPDLRKIPR